jgi:hypothetical protein
LEGEFLSTRWIALPGRFKDVFNGFDIDEMYDLEGDAGEMRNGVADRSTPRALRNGGAIGRALSNFKAWTLPRNAPDRPATFRAESL